ncbi:stabilizer of axonemal microtubules 2-like isoform X2 [Engraulis encrasicolus]
MLLKTTYLKDFRGYPASKTTTTSIVDEYKPPITKMDTQTAYNDAYHAWEPQPKIPYKQVDNLKMNEGSIDMTTVFQADYRPKENCRRKSFKPEPKLMESLPFEGKSVYSQMYVPHPVQQYLPKQKVPFRPSSAPFEATSVHRQDFTGERSSSPVKCCKVKGAWEPRSTPFDGKSECQEKFQAWTAAVRPSSCANKQATYSLPETGDVELTSMTRRDFKGTPGRPASSARPSINKSPNRKKRFEARTTAQDDFIAWKDVEKSTSCKPKVARQPCAAFEGISTFQAAFTGKATEPAKSFKPVRSIMSPSTMDCDTVYRSTFKEQKAQPLPGIYSQRQEGQVVSLGKNGFVLCQTWPLGERNIRPMSSLSTPGRL